MKPVLLETTAGDFAASFSDTGLAHLEFPADEPPRKSKGAAPRNDKFSAWEQLTRTALQSILQGHQPNDFPPLDLSEGTQFQQSVWNALRNIPMGRTQSYAEVARAIGRPKAIRAVGQACGANPIPVLIPCHRVLAAHCKLGGFSGGLVWKEKLLAIEGVEFSV